MNEQEGTDEGGWEYSFAFSKKFSWHGPAWWNSYVRRRAWTRKRARKTEEPDENADPHMLNNEYFTIRPASQCERTSRASFDSRVPSKASMTQISSTEDPEEHPDIENVETLLQRMRSARVDREKLEAANNYIEHAVDLSELPDSMHDIMGLFVFQASRRLLLSRLMQAYDDASKKWEADREDDGEVSGRGEALRVAVKGADEEVRRLAYWSDIKRMAERGQTRGAVDGDQGWADEWEGLDRSGPGPPNNGKLPGKIT